MKACVQPDGISDTGELWNFLFVPDVYTGIAAYGKFLIGQTSSGDLHALSPDTESWVHVGRLDNRIWYLLMTVCTGELPALTREYGSLHVKLLSVKGIYVLQRRKKIQSREAIKVIASSILHIMTIAGTGNINKS